MALKLSVDILSIIFEDVEKDNDKSLYSCLFINREWCQTAVPFLWKNPWKKIDSQCEDRYKSLFKCFVMMMSKGSKDFLKMKSVNFLIEDILSLQKPLFNYARFCKVIDSLTIYDMICYNIKDENCYHQYLVEQEILKLLINNTSKLKCLVLFHKSHPIAFFPNSSTSLSHLNELHCDTSIDSSIFYGLSQLCRNIERLFIEGYNDDNYGLILLIEQQINLKKVKISENEEYGVFSQGQCRNLGEALSTKSSSIIELDLGQSAITIPPLLLQRFQNLTIFKFCIDYDLTEERVANEFENILRNLSLPNLQQLIIYDDFSSPLNIIANIIEKTNGDLRKLNLGTYYYNEIEDADSLVSAIAKHCPKLELLTVWVDNFDEMEELFKKCKELRGLVLRSVRYKQNLVELVKVLYNNASNKLSRLQLEGRWEITKEVLTDLFENWKQQERNPLDFYISSYMFKGEYEDVVNRYQELNVIGKFDKRVGTYNFLDNSCNL